MSAPLSIDPSIRACLDIMLEDLTARLREGTIRAEDYAKTLKYLRFKIGEDLYDEYEKPFEENEAIATYIRESDKGIR